MTDYYQDYEEWCRQYDKKDVPPPQKTWRDSFRETCDTLKAGLAATAICVVFLGGVVWLMTLIPEPEPFQTKAPFWASQAICFVPADFSVSSDDDDYLLVSACRTGKLCPNCGQAAGGGQLAANSILRRKSIRT